ncbi:aspartyl-phosphate phosphatase Spo0E family protein [Sporosarcina sp. FSL K6-1522]
MLSVRITYKRKMMYVKAKEFGYTHPEVVAHSQDLDDLLNRYQGIIS